MSWVVCKRPNIEVAWLYETDASRRTAYAFNTALGFDTLYYGEQIPDDLEFGSSPDKTKFQSAFWMQCMLDTLALRDAMIPWPSITGWRDESGNEIQYPFNSTVPAIMVSRIRKRGETVNDVVNEAKSLIRMVRGDDDGFTVGISTDMLRVFVRAPLENAVSDGGHKMLWESGFDWSTDHRID